MNKLSDWYYSLKMYYALRRLNRSLKKLSYGQICRALMFAHFRSFVDGDDTIFINDESQIQVKVNQKKMTIEVGKKEKKWGH